MGPIDAVLHFLNFFAPALGVAALSAGAAKLLWRKELAGVTWHRLAAWSAIGGSLALVAGLVAFGRDGKMATYGLLVAASAIGLWWAAFLRR